MDREPAAKILQVYPLAGVLARENRAFLARAVDYVSRQGCRPVHRCRLGATQTWADEVLGMDTTSVGRNFEGSQARPARRPARFGAGRGLPSPEGLD